jgi:hypothetical protein
MGYTIPYKEYKVIDEGVYAARIASAEPVEGQYGQQIKFSFDVLDADEETSLLGWASAKLTPKTKLFEWAKAAMGDQFEPGQDLNIDDFVGRKVQLVVARRLSADGSEFNKVEKMMRYKARSQDSEEINRELGYEEPGQPPAPRPFEEGEEVPFD